MATDSIGQTTKDHDEIRDWVEEHGGHPAVVQDTRDERRGGGVLRVEFPGGSDEGLARVSWAEWFQTFDSRHLSFLYQARKADGEDSTFCKLIDDDA